MKIKLICACLAIFILAAACAGQPSVLAQYQRHTLTPIPAGHYSLFYLSWHSQIPVTGLTAIQRNFARACNEQEYAIQPRFGRSLYYRCHDVAII